MAINSNIANEVDAIIARAMAEYAQAKGVDVFGDDMVVVQSGVTNLSNEESVIREEPTVIEVIPHNSTSILVDEQTSRFSSAAWFDNVKSKSVTLAGLGGIGSYVAFLLSRLKIQSLFMYDDDTVEAGNMSGQLYSGNDINSHKVSAMSNMVNVYSGYYDTYTYTERFTENSQGSDIMICGFDNMDARRTFFNVWKARVYNYPPELRAKCLFIDGRLAAESLQILCIMGDDTYNMEKYEREFLFNDWEAEAEMCSYKQTSFMANMIGSLIVNLFVNFCANECDPLIPRDLPFFTEYTAETMYLKVVN